MNRKIIGDRMRRRDERNPPLSVAIQWHPANGWELQVDRVKSKGATPSFFSAHEVIDALEVILSEMKAEYGDGSPLCIYHPEYDK